MRKVLMLASTASMIDQFNMPNIRLLQGMGFKVDVACNFIEGNTSSDERVSKFKASLGAAGVEYHQVDFARNVWNFEQNLKALRQTERLVREGGYFAVHCHSPIGGVCARIAGHKARVKVLYTAHGFHFYKGAPLVNWLLYYPAERLLSRWTDALITINKEDFARAQKRMRSKATYYIPGIGVDLQRIGGVTVDRAAKRRELGLPQEAKLLLSVGELIKRKNHEVVLRALSKMDTSRLAYAICGRGALEGCLKDLAKQLGLKDKVFFLGFRDDVIEICKAADVFVFPSLQEGLPMALMEAFASGLPAACSNIRGNVDLMEGAPKECLFPPKDEAAVRAALMRLLQDEAFAHECAERNREAVKAFSLEKSMQAMAEIYGAVMEQHDVAFSRKRQGGGHKQSLAFPTCLNPPILATAEAAA